MMREHKRYKVTKIYPRFKWIQCEECLFEFKKIAIYKITENHLNHNTTHYFCEKCYTTKSLKEFYDR